MLNPDNQFITGAPAHAYILSPGNYARLPGIAIAATGGA